MLRHERRLLIDSLFIGAALTLLVIAVDAAGFLEPAENYLYDLRCRLCQHFTPPPTDKLVHLDIDDAILDTIGRWPWPRATVARLLEEVRLAGPRAVELDVLLSEPQEPEFRPGPPGPGGADGSFDRIDNDAELAAAIGRLGNVIVPATPEV